MSCIIRKRKVTGGIILTASHNPGGPKGDFGIKYNMGNGGPAPTEFTDHVYKLSQEIKSYTICPDLKCDFDKVGTVDYQLEGGRKFTVEVVDSLADYIEMMKSIFDFSVI